MIDDALVLRVERLRDGVEGLGAELKARYGAAHRPVIAPSLRDQAAQLGERWLVEIAARDDVAATIGSDTVAALNVDFQRLITYSEASTARKRYDTSIRGILRDFRTRVVVPLKQSRNRGTATAPSEPPLQAVPGPIFIAQSFAEVDAVVNGTIGRFVEAFGHKVVTGEKPKADSVSKKVRERIEAATYFLGIFTRRDRVHGRRNEWTTSTWVIDEKAYALANRKKLVLIREAGVQSIGGIQGDYEYLEFTRETLADLLVKLVPVLRGLGDMNVSADG
jgi:hypothetical protein